MSPDGYGQIPCVTFKNKQLQTHETNMRRQINLKVFSHKDMNKLIM